MRDHVRFYLNGQAANRPRRRRLRLADRLPPPRLRPAGTKVVCAEGDCGACTVLVGRPDGDRLRYVPVDACIQFLYQLDGTHVVTVEGLGRERRPASGPGGDGRPSRLAVRLLHAGLRDGARRLGRRRRPRRRRGIAPDRQPVPLHRLRADSRRGRSAIDRTPPRVPMSTRRTSPRRLGTTSTRVAEPLADRGVEPHVLRPDDAGRRRRLQGRHIRRPSSSPAATELGVLRNKHGDRPADAPEPRPHPRARLRSNRTADAVSIGANVTWTQIEARAARRRCRSSIASSAASARRRFATSRRWSATSPTARRSPIRCRFLLVMDAELEIVGPRGVAHAVDQRLLHRLQGEGPGRRRNHHARHLAAAGRRTSGCGSTRSRGATISTSPRSARRSASATQGDAIRPAAVAYSGVGADGRAIAANRGVSERQAVRRRRRSRRPAGVARAESHADHRRARLARLSPATWREYPVEVLLRRSRRRGRRWHEHVSANRSRTTRPASTSAARPPTSTTCRRCAASCSSISSAARSPTAGSSRSTSTAAADVAGHRRPSSPPPTCRREPLRPDLPRRGTAGAARVVHYLGQPIVAIAGEQPRGGRARPRRWCSIEVEPLPAVLTIDDAIARQAVHRPDAAHRRGDASGRARRRAEHRLERRAPHRRAGAFLPRDAGGARHPRRRRADHRPLVDAESDRDPGGRRPLPRAAT